MPALTPTPTSSLRDPAMKPRIRTLAGPVAVVGVFVACNLNPQPLPPADEALPPDGGIFTSLDSGPARTPPIVTAEAGASNGVGDAGAEQLVDGSADADSGDADAGDAGADAESGSD